MKATSVQIAEALGVSKRGINKRANTQNWPTTGEKVRGGGKVYDLESLPLSRAERVKVEGYLSARNILENELPPVVMPTVPAIPDVPAKYSRGIPLKLSEKTVELTEKQKRMAMARYELVRQYTGHLEAAGWKKKCQSRDEFIVRYKSGEWPEVKALLGDLSWKTIESWKVALRNNDGDPLVLADTRGGHLRGTSKITADQAAILRVFAFHPNKLRISYAIRMARKVMAERGIDNVSEATCRRYINKLKTEHYPEWVFYRVGEQALENECGYTIERDFSMLDVGDMLTADGHVLNFEVINPHTGKPCRPVLILWYDTRSNMPLGWELMPTENTQAIHIALRRAIIALGKLPKVAYLDNGRAFKAKYFRGSKDFENGAISGLYGRLGIEARFTMAYHGQSKTVERFFGTMLEIESVLPTYIGNSIDNKPARMHRGETLHRRLWEKYGGSQVAISMEQAHHILAAWFDDYANRPQRGNLKGKSPIEVFNQGKGPGVDRAKLIELMMSVELRHIRKSGIEMFGQNYYHPALYGRKKPVLVRYDLMDKEALYLFEKDGSFLGAAEPKAKIHPCATVLGTERDRELLKKEFANKNRLKSLTVGPARKLLKEEILPQYTSQIEEIGLIELPQPEEKASSVVPIARKSSKKEHEKWLAEAEEAAKLQKQLDERDFDLNLEQLDEADRYDKLLQLSAQGVELSPKWTGFMDMYEQTAEYERDTDYWNERRIVYGMMYQSAANQA